jgi:chromosome segregation ATPase
MSPLAFGWIVAGLALAASAALYWRSRSLTAEVDEFAERSAVLQEQLEASERRFEERAKAQRKRGEEIAELKKKLEKARKRAAAAHHERSDDSSRLQELEGALARAEAERLKAQRQVDALRAELERRPTAPRPAAAPAAPVPPVAPEPSPSPGAQALVERAEKAEARLKDIETELRQSRKEVERHKRRASSLDIAYVAQHGELEVKKDRLKTQQEELERLRAMRVTLGAAEPESPSAEPEHTDGD